VRTNCGFENDQIELSSTDANIPLLAIQAANELDEIIEGRATPLDSVRRLADVLKKSFRLPPTTGAVNCFVDSGTVAVFSHAIDESGPGGDVATLEDLIKRATEIVSTLETSTNGGDHSGLGSLRDFCIALSGAAAAYQQSIFELRPAHPFHI
jgi:hypothetical protein